MGKLALQSNNGHFWDILDNCENVNSQLIGASHGHAFNTETIKEGWNLRFHG